MYDAEAAWRAQLRRTTVADLASVPTVFLWGAQDAYLAPERARPWVGRIPSASLHVVPGRHAPWLDDPAACAAVIARHLAQTGSPPGASPSRTEPAA